MAPLSQAGAQSDAAAAQDVAALSGDHHDVAGASIAELQALMSSHRLSAQELLEIYLRRIQLIDKGLDLRAIIQLNPDARRIAQQLDQERRRTGRAGPLHGIPILLKDNIDTGDRMQTTAGSLALAGRVRAPGRDGRARLRAAGAVILGKTNLCEWANFRGFQARPAAGAASAARPQPAYCSTAIPAARAPAPAPRVAANLTAAGAGTETDGSIVCPGGPQRCRRHQAHGGLDEPRRRRPISHTQDTVGPHARIARRRGGRARRAGRPDARDPQTAASAGQFSTRLQPVHQSQRPARRAHRRRAAVHQA